MSPQPARILLVDDEQSVQKLLAYPLRKEGYEVVPALDGEEALERCRGQNFDLIVLDVMLPKLDGFDVCRQIRAQSSVPIIMLTAKAEEFDKVLGLELGADDYITKPFAMRELVARVKAVLRRFERPSAPSVISFEEVVIDASAMQLKVRGELTTTTATEFRLLDYLARHPGRVFSRDHLLDAVWGDARFVTPRSVDVYVRRIREKIESDPESPRYLKTVRGAGYRFEVPKAV
jgi:DNA-binding response OmpR family regulator